MKSIESDDEKSEETKAKYQYDAMISYCHADKEIVYRIHQYLIDQGFKIWFDRDNIYGPGSTNSLFISPHLQFITFPFSYASDG